MKACSGSWDTGSRHGSHLTADLLKGPSRSAPLVGIRAAAATRNQEEQGN